MNAESLPNLVELLYQQLLEGVFNDEERLKKLALQQLRILQVSDVAYLMGIKDPNTVKTWHREQKNGFRMNVGPDGKLTMTRKDFEEWYMQHHKKPAPKL